MRGEKTGPRLALVRNTQLYTNRLGPLYKLRAQGGVRISMRVVEVQSIPHRIGYRLCEERSVADLFFFFGLVGHLPWLAALVPASLVDSGCFLGEQHQHEPKVFQLPSSVGFFCPLFFVPSVLGTSWVPLRVVTSSFDFGGVPLPPPLLPSLGDVGHLGSVSEHDQNFNELGYHVDKAWFPSVLFALVAVRALGSKGAVLLAPYPPLTSS